MCPLACQLFALFSPSWRHASLKDASKRQVDSQWEERKHFIQWESPPAYQVKDSWQTNKLAEACSPSPSVLFFFLSFLNAHLFGRDAIRKQNKTKTKKKTQKPQDLNRTI